MILPNDIELEKRFICLCQSMERISLDVSHKDFHNTELSNIYKSFCYGEFNPTETSASRFKFSLDKYYEALGVHEFSVASFKHLSVKMMELSERRKLIKESTQTVTNMLNMSYPIRTVGVDKPELPSQTRESVIDTWCNAKKIEFDRFWSIGQKIQTFNTGHVLLLCGMSGTGKTGFTMQMCNDICNANNEKWLFISLEMQKASIFERMMKTAFYMNQPHASQEDSNTFFNKNKSNTTYFDTIITDNMYIIDKSGMDINQIERVIKGQVEKDRSVKTVVIDYAQLISHTTDDYKALSEISRRVPEMAKNYDVRIILLSQLTKDNYDGVKPTPKSIKGAGGLFDNSDEVWCLFRDKDNLPNVLDVMHWKSRHNGAYGKTQLGIYGLYIQSEQYDY
jgi:KaiC/GvpD/RAD55 family RecA-like ATPase